jgi:hypothetical protein
MRFNPTTTNPTDAYVEYADDAAYAIGTQAFCIEAWVYFDTASFTHTIMAQYTNSAGLHGWELHRISTGLTLVYSLDGSTNVTVYKAASTIPTSTWHHIAVARDGSGNLRFFIDGSQIGTTTTGVTGSIHHPATPLRIGAKTDATSGDNPMRGRIDDARLTIGDPVYVADFTPAGPLGLGGVNSGDNLNLDVYQISDIVGRGFPGSANPIVT